MLTLYAFYIVLMWKNETLEKWFYLYGGYIETYETRFGKIIVNEEGTTIEDVVVEQENLEEHVLSEKEKKRHEKYLKIGREGVYRPLSREGMTFRRIRKYLKMEKIMIKLEFQLEVFSFAWDLSPAVRFSFFYYWP